MSSTFKEIELDKSKIVKGIVGKQKLPKMVSVKQQFLDNSLDNIPLTILHEIENLHLQEKLKEGMSIAVTAGSRGINNIPQIIKTVCQYLADMKCKPFIMPAMGSHGGATAEGQLGILEGLGITEASMGFPICSSLDTEVIGHTKEGKPVHFSSDALRADGIVVVGRIKPHTAFQGTYESGLVKMIVIGLGKQRGAESCHSEGFGAMDVNIETYAKIILEKVNIIMGLGIIENAYDRVCDIKALHKDQILTEEPQLLVKAKSLMPKILINEFDILIVDQIGKNFSGDGADPNISGSFATPYVQGGPRYERYIILDLSEETHGNASGLGMADFSTKRAFLKIDLDASYPNCLTSRVVSGVKIPMILQTDKLAIQAAIFCLTAKHKENPRIVRITNTSHIDIIQISESLIPIAEKISTMTILGNAEDICFDQNGDILHLGE